MVTLCGSTRFKNEFMEAQKRLTLEGCIVISVGLFGHSGNQEVWENMDEEYDDPDVMDGNQWSLDIKFSDKSEGLHCWGSNRYPVNFDEFLRIMEMS